MTSVSRAFAPLLVALLTLVPFDGNAQEDDLTTRARVAGLSSAQIDSVAGFGFPLLVPTSAEGLELMAFRVSEVAIGDNFMGGYFDLYYRSEEGACVWVTGANEGIGGGRWEDAGLPPVPVPGLGRKVRILEDPHTTSAAAGRPSAHLGTSWIDLGRGGMHVSVQSWDELMEGCRAMDAEALGSFVASLRPVDPADDELFGG